MTAKTLPDALAIESARGAEHLAQIRAEGWRAGAEAMRAHVAGILDLASQHSMADAIRSLAIPEAPNG
jgi:hypothetical protein